MKSIPYARIFEPLSIVVFGPVLAVLFVVCLVGVLIWTIFHGKEPHITEFQE